jgi:hypothetical protein
MKNLSIEAKYNLAAQMVIMDAIEKGADKDGLIEFMKTDIFKSAVNRYLELIEAA